MSDCCSPTHTIDNESKKYCCPVNGNEYKHVSLTAVLHNVVEPWQLHNDNQGYCFGVTRDAFVADPKIKAFVVKKTKEKQCACDIRNPSGLCCLKGFPRL